MDHGDRREDADILIPQIINLWQTQLLKAPVRQLLSACLAIVTRFLGHQTKSRSESLKGNSNIGGLLTQASAEHWQQRYRTTSSRNSKSSSGQMTILRNRLATDPAPHNLTWTTPGRVTSPKSAQQTSSTGTILRASDHRTGLCSHLEIDLASKYGFELWLCALVLHDRVTGYLILCSLRRFMKRRSIYWS